MLDFSKDIKEKDLDWEKIHKEMYMDCWRLDMKHGAYTLYCYLKKKGEKNATEFV